MKIKRRWMRSALAEASGTRVHLPWERGLRREAAIARRKTRLAPEPMRRCA